MLRICVKYFYDRKHQIDNCYLLEELYSQVNKLIPQCHERRSTVRPPQHFLQVCGIPPYYLFRQEAHRPHFRVTTHDLLDNRGPGQCEDTLCTDFYTGRNLNEARKY